jgi:hypothetical protein
VGVLVLVALAGVDALRGDGVDVAREPSARRTPPAPTARLLVTRAREAYGRRGSPTFGEIAGAFPGGEGGRYEVAHVSAASDGAIVVSVFREHGVDPLRAAVEVWRAGALLAAFAVPPRSIGGGLGFSPDGAVIATFTRDGRPALYDRRGRHVPAAALRTYG